MVIRKSVLYMGIFCLDVIQWLPQAAGSTLLLAPPQILPLLLHTRHGGEESNALSVGEESNALSVFWGVVGGHAVSNPVTAV